MKKANLTQPNGKPKGKKYIIIFLLVCLGALLAISVVRFDKRMKKYDERDSKAKTRLTVEANKDFPIIEASLAAYYVKNEGYPRKLVDLGLSVDVTKSDSYEGLETVYRYTPSDLSASTDSERYCKYKLGAGILVPSWEGQDYYEATSVSKDNC